jgi:NAD(P)H-dependent FMN reductase
MIKLLAFGASNSRNSINKQLASYTASRFSDFETSLVDLNDFPLPVYGIDLEKADGIPENAHTFSNLIAEHDGIIISLAEHNSNYSVAFKNLTDWISRLEGPVWKNKLVFLLSTSPGKRGGSNVMEIALKYMPFAGAKIISHFSLPAFSKNYSEGSGIIDPMLHEEFEMQSAHFQEAIEVEQRAVNVSSET